MTRIKITEKAQRRINIIGKMQPLVDPMKVAIGLGASEVISKPKQSRNGKKYFTVTFLANGAVVTQKKIYELSAEEARDLLFLGAVGGQDFSHCVHCASKHKNNFWQRACGYRTFTCRSSNYPFSITFYEKKK